MTLYTYAIVFLCSDSVSLSNAFFGVGRGDILLDDLECAGTEARLVDCSRQRDDHNCGHKEDAGVRCSGTAFIMNIEFNDSTNWSL